MIKVEIRDKHWVISKLRTMAFKLYGCRTSTFKIYQGLQRTSVYIDSANQYLAH